MLNCIHSSVCYLNRFIQCDKRSLQKHKQMLSKTVTNKQHQYVELLEVKPSLQATLQLSSNFSSIFLVARRLEKAQLARNCQFHPLCKVTSDIRTATRYKIYTVFILQH